MDAWCRVGATVDPAQLLAELAEDAIHLAKAQRGASAPAARGDEERRIGIGAVRDLALRGIALQRRHGAGMQRHVAGLGELGLPHRQQAGVKSTSAVRKCSASDTRRPAAASKPNRVS